MNSQEIAVHIEHVYKNYTSGHSIVHALKDISLDIYKGELIMVVGPSGSGKTTLLSLVGGTLSFNSGEISVFDNPLHTMTEEELTLFRKDHIGFIFQQFHLIPTLTTAENVAIPLLIHQVPWEKALKKAEETLEHVHLFDKAPCLPKELSGGEQQRVAIARALVAEPRLIICDEPTSNLDATTGKKILEILRSIANGSKRSVIIVTHDARILDYADRIAEMDDGAIKEIHT